MSSIFELPSDLKQVLGSTEQLARMTYEQIPATREISSTNFSNGAISFKFSMSGQKHWIPNKSYLRTRVKLTKNVAGDQLALSDNVAPNMDLTACLFQSAEFRMGDKTISRISDNLAQVDALETRLNKSKAWIDGAGSSSNFWQDDFKVRQADVCVDGIFGNSVTPRSTGRVDLGFDAATNTVAYDAATGVITFAANGGGGLPADVRLVFPVGSYFVFTGIVIAPVAGVLGVPLLVISGGSNTTLATVPNGLTANVAALGTNKFSRLTSDLTTLINDARRVKYFETVWCPPLSIFKIGKALPSGKYELVLNPATAQNLQKAVVESIGADKVSGVDYIVEIVSMYLYIETVYGPRGDNLQYLLDLESCRAQSDTISGNSLVQKQFDVSPSTVALTVAYQDARAGLDTRVSATKFKSYNVALTSAEETKLDRFFLQYAGQNYPSIDSDEVLDDSKKLDWTTQRYVESQLYSGAWFDTGSSENATDYKNRGMYIHFKTPRDSTDRSTRVSVNSQFTGADTANLKLLVFDHSKQLARITVEEGQITNVQIEDA